MRTSFREIADETADFRDLAETPTRLRELVTLHRWRPNDERSLRDLANRHFGPSSTTSKSLWYNTWLLDPVGLFGEKPEVNPRAREIGRAIDDSEYDIVALGEVFRRKQLTRITPEITGVSPENLRRGPLKSEIRRPVPSGIRRLAWRRRITSSGLVTVATSPRIVHSETVVFSNRGSALLDADAWSAKGVLMVELDLGVGNVDLYSTHFFAGGGIPGGARVIVARWGTGVIESTRADKADVKRSEIHDLVEFIGRTHTPENVAVVVGDFNINANFAMNPRLSAAEREVDRDLHQDFIDAMSSIELMDGSVSEFRDAWLSRGRGTGGTSFDKEDRNDTVCVFDTSNPPFFCDDTFPTDNGRIDYMFVEEPRDSHSLNLDVSRVRRRPFWREFGIPGSFWFFPFEGLPFPLDWLLSPIQRRPIYMSDHLGLEVELLASSVGS